MPALKHPRLIQFHKEVIPDHDLKTKQDDLDNHGKAERKVYDLARLTISKGYKDKHGTPLAKTETALRDLHTALDSIRRAIDGNLE